MSRMRRQEKKTAGNHPDFFNRFFRMGLLMAAVILTAGGFPTGAADARAGQGEGLARIAWDRVPAFTDDLALDRLAQGIEASISYYHRLPASRRFAFGKDEFSATHLIRSLECFLGLIQTRPGADALQAYLMENFRVYAFVENDDPVPVRFTGYYEPTLNGGLTKTAINRFAVYARPSDLVTFTLSDFSDNCSNSEAVGRCVAGTVAPYDTRQVIEETDSLAGRAAPIAWVDDRVDLFFLQIQGSGRIRLDAGGMIRVHYDGSNGHPYRSIGKYLIDKNKIQKEQISMQSIKAYLKAHPEEISGVLSYNPRYVFFKVSDSGPTGSLNIDLTPGRSIATDQRLFPSGALAFICTQKPVVNASGQITQWTAFSRFVLNQDTGSAIRGPGRADIFWGDGKYAELAAGHLKHPGKMYFLVLNPDDSENP